MAAAISALSTLKLSGFSLNSDEPFAVLLSIACLSFFLVLILFGVEILVNFIRSLRCEDKSAKAIEKAPDIKSEAEDPEDLK